MSSNLGASTQWLGPVIDIARRAGDAILGVYDSQKLSFDSKADASPVTEADLRAHRTIIEGLSALTPTWPVLSEESSRIDFSESAHWSRYWLADSLHRTHALLLLTA